MACSSCMRAHILPAAASAYAAQGASIGWGSREDGREPLLTGERRVLLGVPRLCSQMLEHWPLACMNPASTQVWIWW